MALHRVIDTPRNALRHRSGFVRAIVVVLITACFTNLSQPVSADANETPVGDANASSQASITAGKYHTCTLASGEVWCWGKNDFGQLGDGTTTNSSTPVQVRTASSGPVLTGVTAIAAGRDHTCAVVESGSDTTAWCWGRNGSGRLGDGTTNNSSTPVQVVSGSSALTGVTAITAGVNHTCALLDNGTPTMVTDDTAKCWGYNGDGYLGNGRYVDSSTPVQVIGPGGAPALTGVTAITASGLHTCALASGEVWCWGYNSSGQLGPDAGIPDRVHTPVKVLTSVNGSALTGVTAITADNGTTCALVNNGSDTTAWCWGNNGGGQLGDGTTTNSSTPVQVRTAIGGPALTGVTAITAGEFHTCALVDNGSDKTTWCWGNNGSGRLGNGTTTNSSTPVQVRTAIGGPALTGVTAITAGEFHTCALVDNGSDKTTWCWGNNGSGRLGNGTTTNSSTPVQVRTAIGGPALTGVTAITAGSTYTCALAASTVLCWGDNTDGQLGVGDQAMRTYATPSSLLTITYNANGGSAISDGDTSTTTGATITTLPTDPTRTGYTFAGWNTQANGQGTTVTTTTGHGQTSNFTLHAQWTADTLTITYNPNGGSAISDGDTSTTTGATITTLPTDPTRTGYTFNGWNTQANGQGTTVTTTTGHGQTSNFTLHAQWTPVPVADPSPPAASGSTPTVTPSIITVTMSGRASHQMTHQSTRIETDLVAQAGTLASVSGQHFRSLTTVEVWINSAPRLLATGQVRTDGTFEISVPIPIDLEAGEHTLQINGTDLDGNPQTTLLSIRITVPAELPVTGANHPISIAALIVCTGLLVSLRTRQPRTK